MAARVGATGDRDRDRRPVSGPRICGWTSCSATPARRATFRDAFTSRGLRIAALNCSAWPLHPAVGDRHVAIIRSTIRLAAELGVTQARDDVRQSGRRPGGTAVNFTWYPWPEESMALLERQWDAAIDAVAGPRCRGRGGRASSARLRAAPAPPRLQRPDLRADARRGRPDHRREPRPVAPVLAGHGSARGRPGARSRRSPRPPQGHRDRRRRRSPSPASSTSARSPIRRDAGLGVPDRRRDPRRGRGGSAFVAALRDVGYDDALSIENEDAEPAAGGIGRAGRRGSCGRSSSGLRAAQTAVRPGPAAGPRRARRDGRPGTRPSPRPAGRRRPRCGRRSGSRGSCSAGGRRSRARAASRGRPAGSGGPCPSRTARSRGTAGSARP